MCIRDSEQVVLIENEFGEIGIDGGFLKDSGIEIREMNSGCICCSLVGDFGASLAEMFIRDSSWTVIPSAAVISSGMGRYPLRLAAVHLYLGRTETVPLS